MYFTKNAKETHPEFMEEILGCQIKETAALQKESFQAMVKGTLDAGNEESETMFMEVQDQLHAMVSEYKSLYSDVDMEPMVLTHREVEEILKDSGVSENLTKEIAESFEAYYGDQPPLAESLIDNKVLKEKDQRRKEERLKKEVILLKGELEKAKEQDENEEETERYDVVLKVKADRIPEIKSQIIDGRRYLVIPVEENEQTLINGDAKIV